MQCGAADSLKASPQISAQNYRPSTDPMSGVLNPPYSIPSYSFFKC